MKKPYIKPEITKEELREMLIAANEKLEQANERLIRQEKERTEFFANLSHDLRASLNVISGAVELLREEESTGDGELLSMIAARCGFMQRLVEDMFFLAKLDSRAAGISLRAVDLRAFLEDYFFTLKADKGFQDRELILKLPEEFSAKAEMDPKMITRVLDNLFSNARKYSEKGDAVILRASEGESSFTVCVRDHGQGICAEDLPRIFERTFRSSRARTPEEGSSGLGLSIAKGIVEACGGQMSCESEEGKGSVFCFTLRKYRP